MANCNHPYEAVRSVNIEAIISASGRELTVNSKQVDLCESCGEVFSKNNIEKPVIKVGRQKVDNCSHEESGETVSRGEITVQTVDGAWTIRSGSIPVCGGCGFPPEEYTIRLN